ncbi:hypothetical protein H6P81_015948 [Aristolochia fimbriata]|uniref:Sister chromatid cohesion protein DCC1 n=1 Tax=Aristolochia fimbriata TaxID=158543 RepID=A0AAV7E706_ARIFI|nr:hypothetical protein H6P81_015948 [Aristolochia fimbriata]
MAGGAEAVLSLEPNSAIRICYHSDFGSHDEILLLEVDDKLLPDILQQRTSVRGLQDEDAVLCTPSATYALKFVGNSNSVFLIPPANATNDETSHSNLSIIAPVIKIAPGNMELVHVAPKLDKLKTLLAKNPYRPEEEEQGDEDYNLQSGLYRWEDLTNIVQASDEELKGELQALSAVEIGGYWRLVEEKAMGQILTLLLHNSVLCDWSLASLKEDEVVATLVADGFSRTLALHCLETYGFKENRADECVWGLDPKKVCVYFARQVLGDGKKKMENFMDEWARRIPTGMVASLEMLEGEVLMEKVGIETWIRVFSASSLPSTPAERFAALFQERQKWERKDLNPYIRNLRVPGMSLEGLLIKYTRRTQPKADVEPVFSAR